MGVGKEEDAVLMALKMENEAMKPRNSERVKKQKQKQKQTKKNRLFPRPLTMRYVYELNVYHFRPLTSGTKIIY